MIVPSVDGLRLRRFAVQVQAGTLSGTGWFVAPGWVLTCAHLVKEIPDGSAVAVTPDPTVASEPQPAVVRARTAYRSDTAEWPWPDLALLELPDPPPHSCPRLSDQLPQPGDQLVAYGFPPRDPGQAAVWRPVPLTVEGTDEGGYVWLRAGQAAPGLSGGLLVCPRQLAVVGVVTTSRDPRTDLGALAAPVCALAGPVPGLPELPEAFGGLAADLVKQGQAALDRDPVPWRKVFHLPEDTPPLLRQDWSEFTRRTRTNPSDLLQAGYGVVPYLFRDRDLAEAEQWCERTDEAFAGAAPEDPPARGTRRGPRSRPVAVVGRQ